MHRVRKLIGYLLYILLGSWMPHYQLGHEWIIPRLLRQLAGKCLFDYCGKRVDIGRKVTFSSKISLGNRSGIGDRSFFQGEVYIGNDVMMGPACSFIASGHNFSNLDIPMNLQGEKQEPIIIQDNVWIGYGVTILSGVEIGTGSVIGAGAVVTKSIPRNVIVGGVPAKIIRDRGINA